MAARYNSTWLFALALSFALFGFVAPNPAFSQPAEIKRPNFIFIFGDDWGWGDLGCYGHHQIKTPHLDQLADQGILFTQFYVTSPVCSPSRTGFLTGQFPSRLGVHAHFAAPDLNAKRQLPDWLDPNVVTVTDLLKGAGYKTGHFGKWHLGGGPNGQPDAPEAKEYGFDDNRVFNGNGPDWDAGKENRHKSTEVIVDETIRFIEANKGGPFYVQAWLLDTHAYLAPTDEQREPYKNLGGALEVYYAAATAADKQIGRLLAKLDELGLADDTVVVFSSDNGPEDISIVNASHSGVGSAGPFRGRKRSLYEGGVRTPFIARWPSHIPAGKVDKDTVLSGVDFLPTVCGLAGIAVPEQMELDGEDLSPALLGTPKDRAKPLMWEFRFGVVGHVINKSPTLAIREGNWKLLMNPDRSRLELYDIPEDPSELTNVAASNPEVVQKLETQVLAWSETLPGDYHDPGAGVNAYAWPE